ncbi:MAG: hypothetical protein ABR962_03600 [Candidatus Bathyarchaeia archaeon]|jgi:hypothetical protein
MSVYSELVKRLIQELHSIDVRLSKLEEVTLARNPQPIAVSEPELLAMPDHLRKTFMVLSKIGKATAFEVSLRTGRARACESSCLNQLVLMGFLEKRLEPRTEVGRKVAVFGIARRDMGRVQENSIPQNAFVLLKQ